MYKNFLILSFICICFILGACSKSHTITGEVIFPDYEQGYIDVGAFKSADPLKEHLIAYVTIQKPGPFKLTIPLSEKIIYLHAYNDSDNDGPPPQPHDPVFSYPLNPIYMNKSFKDIDLTICEPKSEDNVL